MKSKDDWGGGAAGDWSTSNSSRPSNQAPNKSNKSYLGFLSRCTAAFVAGVVVVLGVVVDVVLACCWQILMIGPIEATDTQVISKQQTLGASIKTVFGAFWFIQVYPSAFRLPSLLLLIMCRFGLWLLQLCRFPVAHQNIFYTVIIVVVIIVIIISSNALSSSSS